ncbi:MAG: 5'/3'-nucleotidase SurE [Anaerolineae bacterium]|nr:5'/3'-nucleotidase SurE [Anaerolineae bacterium]
MSQKPVILLTNDDGIQSPGLWAAAEALSDIGYVEVVAPREQQSGMGRSLPVASEGRIYKEKINVCGKSWTVYAVDGTPAQAVQHGLLELIDRLPALVVAGINYGENVGNSVTISGTVGAAMEAASFGIPALAISQQMPVEKHHSYDQEDFSAGAHFARFFGRWLIQNERPDDVDVIKVEVPENATPETPWRVARLSRRRVFWPTRPERTLLSDIGRLGYEFKADPARAEPDSDVYAVLKDGVVAVTPLSLDMTSRTDLFRLWQMMQSR